MSIYQKTIKNPIDISGIGIHSGLAVHLKLIPAPENYGIRFFRSDQNPMIEFPADAMWVTETQMASTLSHPQNPQLKVATVEHCMSALFGLGIDNLRIEISAAEVPIMEGSSAAFVYAIQAAGRQEQSVLRQYIKIKKPIRIDVEDKWVELLPCENPNELNFSLDFTIDFKHPAINQTGTHYFFEFSEKNYLEEISKARTFGFVHEVDFLRRNNLALGGGLNNAIVLDEYRILNSEGLRYPEEFVRHKILDAIGDLYLAKAPFLGQYRCFKAGHALNNQLVRHIFSDKENYEMVTF